jgi:hypothetical protein
MGKHIQAQEHPLKAPPHSGSSKPATVKGRPKPVSDSLPPSAPERSPEITDGQIATRAYEIWLESGCPEGADRENWLEAEHQLRDQLTSPHEATAPLVATIPEP